MGTDERLTRNAMDHRDWYNTAMIRSVEGIFRNGKVELLEPAPEPEGSRVVVTFIPPRPCVDLHERGIGEVQAADLRSRLRTFAEDWDRPEMDVYDEA